MTDDDHDAANNSLHGHKNIDTAMVPINKWYVSIVFECILYQFWNSFFPFNH
jgi:hypothetical protein